MEEVFLALKPTEAMGDPLRMGDPGTCVSRWIYDASLVSQYMTAGWHVFRVNGFQRIVEATVEFKMEKPDGCEQCPESPKPNHKRGR